MAAFDDRTRAQEADTCDHALQHAADVADLHAALQRHQHENRRAQRHQHVRAQAGSVLAHFALDAEHATKQHRRAYAQQDRDILGEFHRRLRVFPAALRAQRGTGVKAAPRLVHPVAPGRARRHR
ncbi:hypothetical protein G6F63_014104 [Rhizopus arrhizus]|nr:hypothetical protein G6F63_014104 [Rhizopus arrhizus]